MHALCVAMPGQVFDQLGDAVRLDALSVVRLPGLAGPRVEALGTCWDGRRFRRGARDGLRRTVIAAVWRASGL